MRIKNILFTQFLIFLNIICLTLSQLSTIPTNYTRSDLLNLKKEINCNEDKDCPFGSYCYFDTCYFNFLCPEDINEKCVSLNSTAIKFDSIPIINSCYKEFIGKNSITKFFSKCHTRVCNKNSDCYSGICYYGTCATETPIYKCEGRMNGENNLSCGKDLNMKCNSSEECLSNYCAGRICGKEIVGADLGKCIIFLIILIPIVIIVRRIIVYMEKRGNNYKELKIRESD